jgi:hypothetical protein
LQQGYSPPAIAALLREAGGARVVHETIIKRCTRRSSAASRCFRSDASEHVGDVEDATIVADTVRFPGWQRAIA